MVSFLYRVPSGMVGAVNRAEHATVEPGLLLVSQPPLTYGAPVVVDASTGRYRAFAANDAATVIAGMIIRPYPENSATPTTDVLAGLVVPDTRYTHDILKRGYVTVKQTGGIASAKDSKVYLRTTGLSADNPLGALQAGVTHAGVGAANGGNTGNPTFGAIVAGTAAVVGVYTIAMTSATAYTVTNPSSVSLQTGVLGTAYPNATGEVGFTLTAGTTPAISGDTFTITVTATAVLGPAKWLWMGPCDAQGFGEISLNL